MAETRSLKSYFIRIRWLAPLLLLLGCSASGYLAGRAILIRTVHSNAYGLTSTAQAVSSLPGKGLALEKNLLRRLAFEKDWEGLATALDRSMVGVPAGKFKMGSDAGPANERPQVLVYLDAYAIDRYEVTNAQYQRFVSAGGADPPVYWKNGEFPAMQGDYPVVGVGWEDAAAYCAWAGKRLLTEAEWEKACRGTQGQAYPWGNEWKDTLANVDHSPGAFRQHGRTGTLFDDAWQLVQVTPAKGFDPALRPVGSFPEGASLYGALDMAGNASEWVADFYNWAGYAGLSRQNPLVTAPAWNHCFRGSAWFDPYGSSDWVKLQSRCSARNSAHVSDDLRIGFRCARPTQGPS